MRLRSMLLSGLVILTACGDDDSVDNPCLAGTVVPPADTLFEAKLDGRGMQAGSAIGATTLTLVRYSTGERNLDVTGRVERAGGIEQVQLTLINFNGVGAYPLNGMDGQAFYSCFPPPYTTFQPLLSASRPSGDTLWVTAYDSAAQHVEGRFQFYAGATVGDGVQVSEGRFWADYSTLDVAAPPMRTK